MHGRTTARRLPVRLVLGALPGALLITTAVAQTPPPGRLLASNCFQCHGTNGKGPGFETIAGKSANSLYEEMREMRAGKEGNGLMPKHAMGYTDAQLRLIADWLSRQR
jgi:cytochrome subunit of sulfide dehydrogenase